MNPTLTLAALMLAASAMAGWPQAEAEQEEAAEPAAGGGDGAAAQAGGAAMPGSRTLELGFAGLMDNRNRTDLEPINLTAGEMQSPGQYSLESGGYYTLEIVSDGTQELAIEAPDLFRNIWINEVVINDIEVRPLGLDSIEFDAAGSARLSFVAIAPGQYTMRIPGTSGETQQARFVIQ